MSKQNSNDNIKTDAMTKPVDTASQSCLAIQIKVSKKDSILLLKLSSQGNKGSSKGSFRREGTFLVSSVSQYLLYLTR